MKTLLLIPARAGSKGLPGKNSRLLGTKPLICHTLDFAKSIKNNSDTICLSTNDKDIIEIAKEYSDINLIVRPDKLSNDTAGMNEVILHAIQSFEEKGLIFEKILLLQPTTPFREASSYYEMCKILNLDDTEITVSVVKSKLNPYFNLFEENKNGFIEKCKYGDYTSRQDCPDIYAYNGSMYLMKVIPFKKFGLHGMKKVKKFEMQIQFSIDIDTIIDWKIAEYFIENTLSQNSNKV